MPIGAPGWPLLAFSMASAARQRTVSAARFNCSFVYFIVFTSLFEKTVTRRQLRGHRQIAHKSGNPSQMF